MTVVIGTAGHIDHGKTTLLRALTGIDADRLPEERRRGLTIDVGYAHGSPDGGAEIDYVDVPGHDRLVGNMLVGVGEIDACLLVVAADDGPQAQTREHLGLLHAMGIEQGLVAVTKTDLVANARLTGVTSDVADLLSRTSLAGVPILPVSAASRAGLEDLRSALASLRDSVAREQAGRASLLDGPWLAVDRVFSIRGRGVVVTGSSRGLPIATGQSVGIRPGDLRARVRGIEVHDSNVPQGPGRGRVALNLAGVGRQALRRGQVLTSGDADAGPLRVTGSDRLLVALQAPARLPGRRADDPWPPADGVEARMHVGTDQAGAIVGRSGRDGVVLPDGRALALLRLDRPVATAPGDRFVLSRPRPASLLAGGVVLDSDPPRGRSRRRQSPERLNRLVMAVEHGTLEPLLAALLGLHGHLPLGDGRALAPDVQSEATAATLAAVEGYHADRPHDVGLPLSGARTIASAAIRRLVSIDRPDAEQAAASLVAGLTSEGRLRRDGDAVHAPGHRPSAPDAGRDAAKMRLVALLDSAAPPPLSDAARESGTPPGAVRELEHEGRIVVAGEDLAWSAAAFERLRELALALALDAPLTPAALRDATGTSRKYVMALLEELDRRGILRRTPEGHVKGPRAGHGPQA